MRRHSSDSEAGEKRANFSGQSLKGLDDAHLYWGGQSTESTDLYANDIWKHPHRQTQEIICNLGTSYCVTVT